LTIFIFSAVGLIMLLARSFAASKIASPIQNYTRLINTLNLSDDSAVNTDNDEILQPQGCTELEHLAIGFNALIERNNEMVRRLHRMNIESEQARLLYQTALQSSSDVVFEYDIESDSLTTYGSALDSSVPKTFASVFDGFLGNIREGKVFGTADIDYAERFLSGDITGEMILTQQADDGTTHWISFEGTPVFSENKAVKAVGTIRCIDDVMTLKENAERDLLSGFYNKATTESIIAGKLSRTSGSSAVILIDIDNFKSINDIFGHSRGDFVIKDIASKINKVVDKNAVAGRIGGDEFMLYLPSASREKTEQICSALCESIRFTYTSESGEGGVDVSASIGAAICPENGSTFEELYGCADIAMYTSKTGGKNRFTLYSGQERPEYKSAER
ncbi:MAG: diguanylate cyclase, partial [Huintestinicola sp.]